MIKTNQSSGFALLITLVVVSVLLSIGLSILDVGSKTLLLSTNAKDSEIAFHAANAGLECIRHWTNVSADDFRLGNPVTINCFGGASQTASPIDSTDPDYLDNYGTGGSVVSYRFKLDYGNPLRCTDAFVTTLVSDDLGNVAAIAPPFPTSDFPWDTNFRGESSDSKPPAAADNCPGVDKCTECPAYGVCTIAYVRGYNTACSNVGLGTSGRFLQREILLEF